MLTLAADQARERFQRVYARFAQEPLNLDLSDVDVVRKEGRELEFVMHQNNERVLERLRARTPEALETEALTLEEIFVATLKT